MRNKPVTRLKPCDNDFNSKQVYKNAPFVALVFLLVICATLITHHLQNKKHEQLENAQTEYNLAENNIETIKTKEQNASILAPKIADLK